MQNKSRQFVSFMTLFKKETYRVFKLWPQTILPPLITSSLYFLIFGTVIGSRIKEVQGVPFLLFMVPGLVMMSVIINSYMNVCSSFFIAKFQKSIEELLVSPISYHSIIFGYTLAGVFRSMCISLFIVLISKSFISYDFHNLVYLTLFSVLTAVLFSLIGLINAIFAVKFDDINIVPTFILTPLSYLGGTFYSINQVEGIWKIILKINPIFYFINGLRYSCFGFSDIEWTNSVVIAIFLIFSLYYLNVFLLKKGIFIKN